MSLSEIQLPPNFPFEKKQLPSVTNDALEMESLASLPPSSSSSFSSTPVVIKPSLCAPKTHKKEKRKLSYCSVSTSKIFGGKGTGAGQLFHPWGVCFDSKKRRLICSDMFNHRLQVFDEDGKYFGSIGQEGQNTGQMYYPRGVCLQPATNNIFVADSGNHRLQCWSEDGECLYSIGGTSSQRNREPGNFNWPYGISCNTQGHVAVADGENHRIQVFDSRGVLLRTFGNRVNGKEEPSLNYPYDVTVDERGRILVANHFKCLKISLWSGDGQQHIADIPLQDQPRGICADHQDRILVTQASWNAQHQVQVLDGRYFGVLQSIGQDMFDWPTGICVDDGDQSLYVADSGANTVQMF